jgi:hypothetical protein
LLSDILMKPEPKQILSVSRRSDIPAFYMPWFMEQVNRGCIEVVNPFNRQVRRVAVSPETVHTMVFWSKNFGPFLAGGYGEQLESMGYHLFFNFTVNSHLPILEPGVPDLAGRLDQLGELCRRFDRATVQWRFDPICHFTTGAGGIQNNLADFKTIAAVAGRCGIDLCITSFMDHYRKIARRVEAGFAFVEPSTTEKTSILLDMQQTLTPLGLDLALCCEQGVLDKLPLGSGVRTAACISGQRIMAVHGGRVSTRRDPGQRRASGCACTLSVDVGSYHLHPCHHNCLFCYANPARDQR